jgi:serine/threonine-protein kinase
VVVGDLVAEKYRVERVLGAGAMGVVLAARHEQLGTLVAVKVMAESCAGDAVLAGRFLREARAAAKLQSDHAARVLDVGSLPSGLPYMVLEYLDGADLSQVLSRGGRLEIPVACDYVLQACEAVAEAHGRGIVHRDLKPDNLYVTNRHGNEPLVKVLDFGVSKVLTAAEGALTSTGVTVGSPIYMAPEQMRSARTADARCDVWALGVVLYELLTERCPFEADSLPDLCLKVERDPPRPLRELRPQVPEALVAVIERCLEKRPADRFANAAELATALEPFAGPASARLGLAARTALGKSPVVVTTASEAPTLPPPVATPAAASPRGSSRAAPALIAGIAMVALVLGWAGSRASRSAPVTLAAAEAPHPAAVPGTAAVAPEPTRLAPEASATAPVTSAAVAPPVLTSVVRSAPPRPPAPRAVRPMVVARPDVDDDIPAFR